MAGVCSVVASSALVTGTGRSPANWGIRLGSGQFNMTTAPTRPGIDWDIAITPLDNTNLVGTDHQFTVTVRYDAGGGLGLQAPGRGQARPSPWARAVSAPSRTPTTSMTVDQGGTSALGTCTVTITSTVTGRIPP